jgi:gamma-glutamyltransferase 2. Threonine peptidase. MEROPS family T03
MYLGTKFAVASESYLATRAGYEVYKAGGNAVDAVVAASAVLTYTLPHLGGVGGDFLALVHAGRVEAVVGFGWAPKRVPKKPPRRGIQSAVVPGLRGWSIRATQTPRAPALGEGCGLSP